MLDNWLSEGYGIIPKKIMKYKGITVYAKAVLAYMMSYTGAGKTECWPTMPTIADDLEISISTVKRSIKELEDINFIEVNKLNPNNPGMTQNKYRIIVIESPELKSCPFCGSIEVEIFRDDNYDDANY